MATVTALASSLTILQQPHQSYCNPGAGSLQDVPQQDERRPTQARGGRDRDVASIISHVCENPLVLVACALVELLNLGVIHPV